jgi:multicomponent K+:H+ antiporter subunit D
MTLPRDGKSVVLVTSLWEVPAIAGLLILIFILTLAAGPALEFTQDTARQILEPANYIQAVLGGGS